MAKKEKELELKAEAPVVEAPVEKKEKKVKDAPVGLTTRAFRQ